MGLQVRVREADSARDLADATDEATDRPQTKAVYELTALVAHIMGDAEEQERSKKKRDRAEPGKTEGHIVAHIKASRTPPSPQPQSVAPNIKQWQVVMPADLLGNAASALSALPKKHSSIGRGGFSSRYGPLTLLVNDRRVPQRK